MNPQIELIYALKSAADFDAQRQVFLNSVAAYGYDTLTFGVFVDPAKERPAEEILWVDNLPAGWMEHYLAQGYQTKDVAVEHCFSGTDPLLWHGLFDDIDAGNLAMEQAQVQQEARDIGLQTGFTQPLRGHDGGRGGISLISRSAITEAEHNARFEQNRQALVAQCEIFYAFSDWRALGRVHYGLSPREKECLKWLAKGLSQKQIGAKLGTHPKTIEKQVAAARDKLQAATTMQAVAKAVLWSMLDL